MQSAVGDSVLHQDAHDPRSVLAITGSSQAAIAILQKETSLLQPLLMIVADYALPALHDLTVSCNGDTLHIGGSNGAEALCDWRLTLCIDLKLSTDNWQEVSMFIDVANMRGYVFECRLARTLRFAIHCAHHLEILTSGANCMLVAKEPYVLPHAGAKRNRLTIYEHPHWARCLVADSDWDGVTRPARWDTVEKRWTEYDVGTYFLRDTIKCKQEFTSFCLASDRRDNNHWPLAGRVACLHIPEYDWDLDDLSALLWREAPLNRNESSASHHVMSGVPPHAVSHIPDALKNWGTMRYFDPTRAVIYALVPCCFMHFHRFRDEETPDDHVEVLSIWCTQLSLVSIPNTSRVDVHASALEVSGNGTSNRITESDWTRVCALENSRCVCNLKECNRSTGVSSYTRMGAFTDGRLYLTDGRGFVAQLHAEPESQWSTFQDQSFASALGFKDGAALVLRP